eukprot:gene7143-7896_t
MEAKRESSSSRLCKATDSDDHAWSQEKVSGKFLRDGMKLVDDVSARSDSKLYLQSTTEAAPSKYASASFDVAEEKARIIEIQQELEAEEEFERLKSTPTVSVPCVAKSTMAKEFVRGFSIMSMNMRDALTGRLMWRSANWDVDEMFSKEIIEEIPKEILQCRVVSREIIFTSRMELENFRLEQRVYYKGVCIEEWFFKFGYVMSGSRNSWQQTIDAAPPEQMLSAEALSGQVVFETAFYDDQTFLCKNSVRIYYV